MLIERIEQILQIKAIQDEYNSIYNREPYNISSWLTSKKFKDTIEGTLKLPSMKSGIDYVYTYSYDEKILKELKSNLSSCDCKECGISITSNTTQAIATIANLLKQHRYKKICILNPAYFSVAQAHRAYGLEYELISVERVDGKYKVPKEILKNGNYDAIWITSPIFSTSVYYSNEDVEFFQRLMDSGTLIISDESFCTPGNEVIRKIKDRSNFIGMYSPHKSLGINAVKFTAIIFPIRFDMFIEHWVDILTGNLPGSTCIAIDHYLSSNFKECLDVYRKFMKDSYKSIYKLLEGRNEVMIDEISDGSLFTLYFRNLTFNQIKSLDFMNKVIFETGTSYYPSYLNGFDETFGFAFRGNIALYNEEFSEALEKLLNYLYKQSKY